MRFRKLAGLVVGALTVGTVVAPGLMSAAEAAPTNKTITAQLSCAFGDFDIAYPAQVALTVDGTAVTATLSDIPPTGMPAFLKVHGAAADVDATVNGEAVTLTGSKTYETPATGNPPIDMPDVAGTRAGTADVSSVSIDSIDVTMTVQAYGPSTSESEMLCTPVAPVVVDQLLSCAFGDFKIAYPAEIALIANGTGVTATLSDIPPTGMPTFLKVHGAAAVVDATVDGEDVTLSGTKTYDTPATGNPPIDMPDVAGTRTGTAPAEEVGIDSIDVTMSVQAGGGAPAPSEMPCTAVGPTELADTQELTCVFEDFAFVYDADLSSVVEGYDVTGELANDFMPGMPAFVTVSKMVVDLDTTIDGEAVTLSGSDTYDPAKPGNSAFPMPALSATREGFTEPTAIDITGATVTITAFGADNVITCTPSVPATETETGLEGDVDGDTVTLSATLTPSDAAGSVEFLEGDSVVGESDVTDGVASLELSDVAVGSHTYTAHFVPTSDVLFTESTSEPVTAKVAAPGPTPACTKAKSTEKAAAAKVKTLTAKVKSSTAKTKAAQAKVKKLSKVKTPKGKKQLKAAKAALKKAQAKLKADTKSLTSAKTALASATKAVKAQC